MRVIYLQQENKWIINEFCEQQSSGDSNSHKMNQSLDHSTFCSEHMLKQSQPLNINETVAFNIG